MAAHKATFRAFARDAGGGTFRRKAFWIRQLHTLDGLCGERILAFFEAASLLVGLKVVTASACGYLIGLTSGLTGFRELANRRPTGDDEVVAAGRRSVNCAAIQGWGAGNGNPASSWTVSVSGCVRA